MVNLAYHAEVLKLLAEVEAIAADLTPNEEEMLSLLRSKYAEPDHDVPNSRNRPPGFIAASVRSSDPVFLSEGIEKPSCWVSCSMASSA